MIDVTNPARPQRVGVNRDVFEASAVVVSGDAVCVAAGYDGLAIYDRSRRPARFEPSPRLDAAGCHLFFRADGGETIRLQRTLDLKSWDDWMTVTATGSSQEVIDESADSDRAGIYRAMIPQGENCPAGSMPAARPALVLPGPDTPSANPLLELHQRLV